MLSPITTYFDIWSRDNTKISPRTNDSHAPTEYETAKLKIIKCMNICESYSDSIELKVYESSELSIIFISEQKKYVYQYFKDYYNFDTNNQIKKGCSLFKVLHAINALTIFNINAGGIVNMSITYNIGIRKYKLLNYTYNLHDYLVNFFTFQPSQKIVVWEKIVPLNKIPAKDMPKFIRKNFTKLVWDIIHGLYAMHLSGRTHGDCSIDNIGYRQETKTFILYDFDMSEQITDKFNRVSDVNKFFNSLEYRGILNKELIKEEYKDKEPIDIIKKMLLDEVTEKINNKNSITLELYIQKITNSISKVYDKFKNIKIR